MPLFKFGTFYVHQRPGIKAWWKRLCCRVWHGEHEFDKRPTMLYSVKCRYCDDTYRLFDIPMPPAPDECIQECPHCHNYAYGGNGKPYWCIICHRTSQEGDGKNLVVNYR